MIFSDREIEKTELEVTRNPKTRAYMYRIASDVLTEGCQRFKANGASWEGKIFMGMDLVEAMKTGWQDDFYIPEVKEVAPTEQTEPTEGEVEEEVSESVDKEVVEGLAVTPVKPIKPSRKNTKL